MKLRRDEGGSALVEFGLLLPLLTLLFVGIVDYALEIQQAMEIAEAAGAGAAFGAVPANVKDLAGMRAAATSAAADVNGFSVTASNLFTCSPGGAAVSSSATCSGYGTPIEYVEVQTSATVPVFLAFPGMPAGFTQHATATYRVPWTP